MKKALVIIALLGVVGLIVAYTVVAKQRASRPEYTVATVQTGDIIQTVSEVGTVKASQKLDLSFLQTGRISKINVKIGDSIGKQDVLAELDSASLLIQKQEAEANLFISQINLDKVLAGASKEDIAVSQENVARAYSVYSSALSDYNKTLIKAEDDIRQAEKNIFDLESKESSNVTPYEKAIETAEINLANVKALGSQAVSNNVNNALLIISEKLTVANNSLDQVKNILDHDEFESSFSARNTSYRILTKDNYERSLESLAKARTSLASVQSSGTDHNIKVAIKDSLSCLNDIFSTLNYCYAGLENSVTSNAFSQSSLDAMKSNIIAQQGYISVAISATQNAEHNLANARLTYETNVKQAEDALDQAKVNLDKAVRDAKNFLVSLQLSNNQLIARAEANIESTKKSWELAKAESERVKSSARAEDVNLARAKIKQAEAALGLINQRISESLITSPIDGQIIDVRYKVGEQANIGATVISILEENGFKVEVDISEADIAKIKQGNKAEITLDAYGDNIKLFGYVSFIEPAEKVIQEVIYYRVTLHFNENEDFESKGVILKPGMTANALITTNQKKNVLFIPARAVIEKNGGNRYARVLVNNEIEERPIEIGLRGDGGLLEILGGVEAGETVVTNIRNN